MKSLTSRQIQCLLYGLLIPILCIIIIYNNFTTYLLAKDRHYSGGLNFYEQNMIIQTNNLNTPKLHLPWYFKEGAKIPDKAQVNPKTKIRVPRIWPEEKSDSDRIEEQLMFIPPNYQYEKGPLKNILLYNTFKNWIVNEGQVEFLSRKCPVNRCTITKNKNEALDIDAIIFSEKYSYSNHKKTDKQIWILLCIESAYYTEFDIENNVINWTATYRYDSDIVIPRGRWAYYDTSVFKIDQLKSNYAQNKTKQVAMVFSNCEDYSGSLLYAKELGKYITVDVYDQCEMYKTSKQNDILKSLNQNYKFYLAFENSNCIDYVTETFFNDGLQHNMLPIVMGGRREDYERIAPKKSYLHIDDFETPKRLAEYLQHLDVNDELYNEYFKWKGTGEFIDTKFLCRLCAMLHDDDAPAKHYQNINDWWHKPNAKAVCDNTLKWQQFIKTDLQTLTEQIFEPDELSDF